ncbi:MAG TPA: zf-HC2 domain-containing protein [Anaerolineales bacterium]|nr:zf-HC2 domain-containing protein [Anaerolineales bacterium]
MHKDFFPLLNAYLDGELHGTRLREMERHLDSCEICRNELTELRRVSSLLRAAPSPEFLPAERFASNLTLSLPRRPQRSQPQSPAPLAWWLVPAGLLGLWFFLQTVFTLTNAVHLANMSGLLGQTIPWLSDGPTQTAWFAVTTNVFGARLTGGEQSTLSVLNGIQVFGADLFQQLFWQAGIFLASLAWFFLWQVRHTPLPAKIKNA